MNSTAHGAESINWSTRRAHTAKGPVHDVVGMMSVTAQLLALSRLCNPTTPVAFGLDFTPRDIRVPPPDAGKATRRLDFQQEKGTAPDPESHPSPWGRG